MLELRLKREGASVAVGQTITPRINRHGKQVSARVSFAQQRLWFLEQLEPGNSTWNCPVQLSLSGGLDVGVLGRALSEIRRRHEILRTRFTIDGEAPVQTVDAPDERALTQIDLAFLAAEQRTDATRRRG